MELNDFVRRVARFESRSQPDQIALLAWHLHTYQGMERFQQADIRACYNSLHLEPPNLSRCFTRMLESRPAQLLQDRQGYRLAGQTRRQLDEKYGEEEVVVAVRELLASLPGKVSDDAERLFLKEAITCYRHGAFRAAIVMTWNLAYDHLLTWVLADKSRLGAFNGHIVRVVGAKKGTGLVMAKREDFEELKESQVLDICGSAGLFASSNTKKILVEQLNRRNMAAHPSLVDIGQPQAEDTITTLANNVVLKLT
jgi:hypothetical protein